MSHEEIHILYILYITIFLSSWRIGNKLNIPAKYRWMGNANLPERRSSQSWWDKIWEQIKNQSTETYPLYRLMVSDYCRPKFDRRHYSCNCNSLESVGSCKFYQSINSSFSSSVFSPCQWEESSQLNERGLIVR